MLFVTKVAMLAALVTALKPLAIDVEIHPKAAISDQQSFDLNIVKNSLARQFASVGIDVAASPALPRLKIYIMSVKLRKSFPVGKTITIVAYAEMLEATGLPNSSPLRIQAASCTASAGSGLSGSAQQGVQLAIVRCVDQLAGQIKSNVVRLRKTKFVG